MRNTAKQFPFLSRQKYYLNRLVQILYYSGDCENAEVALPSLRDSDHPYTRTQGFRPGLEYAAALRL